ncbi:MAG TPA: 50S ribosomal protein L28 [Dehalococcoidia bacterium]|nr:50S ribosomal protein L28 [Dehalococcoidia bacterium]
MAAKCQLCGKIPSFGHNVSHSKRRTNRRWNPNIQRHKMTIDGRSRSMNVCTGCLRTLAKTR